MAGVMWTICVAILATVLITQDHFVEGIRHECGATDCAPRVYFDSVHEDCCGGVVYRKDFNQFGEQLSKCCQLADTPEGFSGAMYSTETHDCCNLRAIIDKSTQGCCGSAGPYELATHGCCDGEIYDKEESVCCNGTSLYGISEGDSCCGNVIYDSKMSTCCRGEVKEGIGECCGNDIYQPNKDLCCQTIEGSVVHTPDSHDFTTGAVQCCGTYSYRPADQLCCNMVAHTKHSASLKCCGNSTYDENTQICCQGHVSPRETANSCCGPLPFNEDNEVCCEGEVIELAGHASCCNGEAYNRESSACVNMYGIGDFIESNVPEIPKITQSFLGENSTAYLSTEKFECGGQLHSYTEGKTSCCGRAITYDSSRQLCCSSRMQGSVVVTKTSPNATCCGDRSYNPETEGCCNGNEPFDKSAQQCCPGDGVRGVEENCDNLADCQVRRGNDKYCLVNENGEERFIPYNRETAICTPSGVRALLPGLAYCGDKAYRTSQEICCQDTVLKRFENNMERECCDAYSAGNYYIPEIETCYFGRVFSIPANVSGFCSGHVYDSRYDGCDVAGHIRRKEEILEKPDVCYHDQTGPLYFNKLHHSCCSGHLIAAGHKCCDRSSECCEPNQIQGYNTETHLCCDGNLVAMEEERECCGAVTYDTRDSSKLCCLNKLHDSHNGNVRCEGETITGRLAENQIICRGNIYTGYNIECCGAEKYDLDNEICCKDFKYPKTSESLTCCGSVAYDSREDALCCGGSLYLDPLDSDKCCGNVTFDTISETCCSTGGSEFVTSTKEKQCCSNGEEFDSSLHTCCDGLIHKFITEGECCGNHVIRDPTREFCCGGRLVYHFGDKRCCHGRIISFNEICSDEN